MHFDATFFAFVGLVIFLGALAKMGIQKLVDKHGRMSYLVTPYTDVVHTAKLSKLSLSDLYGREGVYAAEKRQLSKSEIKRLKLR